MTQVNNRKHTQY